MSLLQLEDVTLRFGGLVAANKVSFAVTEGEVFAVVGPNGAGKSTIFNLISRFYTPNEGEILWQGKSTLGLTPYEIPSLGIARTFQNIELFERMTALENMLIGRHCHVRSSMLSDLFFSPFTKREEYRHREVVEHIIDFLDLQPYRDKPVGGLPYGVRKIIEIGRALAIEPKLLLLDEPASGLTVDETMDLSFWIEDIKQQMGITILMIEHDMKLVSSVSDRVLALADGHPIVVGSPKEVMSHPGVISAYLGTSEEAA